MFSDDPFFCFQDTYHHQFQLLGLALEMERPELEHRSSELLRQTELAKLELNELEQVLLQVRSLLLPATEILIE